MENLKLCAEASLNVELQSEDEVLLFSAFDIERDQLFFVSSANFIYKMQLYSFQVSLFSRKLEVTSFFLQRLVIGRVKKRAFLVHKDHLRSK